MCGLFGFLSVDGRGPNMDTLRHIARVTESRGRDAFGWAWIDHRDGRLRSYRQSGPLSLRMRDLDMLTNAKCLIGHCRYGTHGSELQLINNHPHPCDGGWIVHNGQFHQHREAVETYGLHPSGECDSEVLALLIESLPGTLLERFAKAIRHVLPKPVEEKSGKSSKPDAVSPLALMGLWSKPSMRLVIARRGHPLHITSVNRGHYLASLAQGMPGDVQSIKDGTVFVFGQRKGAQSNAIV